MIAFQERLQHDLPVCLKLKHLVPIDVRFGNAERREVGGDLIGQLRNVEVAAIELRIDNTTPRPRGQLLQTARRLVEPEERLGPCDSDQLAVEPIGPGMIRTRHPSLLMDLAILDKL